MAQATCSIDGCLRPVQARGWCHTHYTRWRRNGDPNVLKTRKRTPVVERIMRRIEHVDGCWQWTGALSGGYGMVTITRGSVGYVHRLVYESLAGPIPDGLHLDHLCRNRACCNPAHLEPVTCAENVRRGEGNGSKTHCPQGHAYEGENVRFYRGRRICVTCNKERSLAWQEAHRAA